MRVTLHVHTTDRVRSFRVRDGAVVPVQDPVDDLVARMRKVLAAQGHVTHDDAEEPGHWVTIHGAHVFVNGQGTVTKGPAGMVGKPPPEGHTPLDTPAGGTKSKVHALLAMGHKFTFEELSDVLGHPPEKALKNALSELKNPKWAGPKGALNIVKGADGKFHVEKTDAEVPALAPEVPAAAPDLGKPVETPVEAPAEPVAPLVPEAKGNVPPPVPEASKPEDTAATLAEAKAKWGAVDKVPAHTAQPLPEGPVTQAKATATYEATIKQALAEAQLQAKTKPADQAKAIALAFKQKKANAMAVWAASVKGDVHTAKVQEVFPSDLKFVDNLATGMPVDEAFAKFKADAFEAKKAAAEGTEVKQASSLTPKAPPPPPAPPLANIEPTVPGVPEVDKQYVPADYKHVSNEDFIIKPGTAGACRFASEMTKLHEGLYADHQEAVGNKKGVQQRLEARLASSPHFARMQQGYAGGGSLVSRLVSQWAQSSGDHHETSVALQMAVKEAFGMQDADIDTSNLHMAGQSDAVYHASAQSLGLHAMTADPKGFESYKQGMRDFVRSMYHETQAEFKKKGITEVCVARGMKIHNGGADGKHVKLKLQPASSFSTKLGIAKSFAGAGSVFFVKVPVSQVLGSFVTGFGCTNEHEVVVLAHPSTEAVQVGHQHVPNMTSAMQHIAQSIGAPKAPAPVKKPPKVWKPGNKVPAFKYAPPSTTSLSLKASKAWSTKIKAAAKTGHWNEVQKVLDDINSGAHGNLPASKKYAAHVIADMQVKHAEYKSQYGLE